MKNGLLICSGTGYYKNIGDYIQSLAAEIFFDKIDVLVEREKLSSFTSKQEKTKVIMNGWFMWQPENFLPSNDIEPLFISFHIVPDIAKKLLTPENVEYLKKHSPIGCRDNGTKELLEKYGVPCYFSGCLTLILGEKYKTEQKSGEILFVDPYYEWLKIEKRKIKFSVRLIFNAIATLFVNLNKVRRINKKFKCNSAIGRYEKFDIFHLDKWLQAAVFYKVYSQKFDDDILFSANFVVHNIPQKYFKNETEKFDCAKKLMKRYAAAKLIITSRIHCALPALAIETPVIFVTSDVLESKSSIRSRGRFGGLSRLFRVMKYINNGLITEDEELRNINEKIGINTIIHNKKDYLPIKAQLLKKCEEFVSNP